MYPITKKPGFLPLHQRTLARSWGYVGGVGYKRFGDIFLDIDILK